MTYRRPRPERKEVLAFFGEDEHGAWAEVFRLAKLLEATGATWKMGVYAELRHGEWTVTLWHYRISERQPDRNSDRNRNQPHCNR